MLLVPVAHLIKPRLLVTGFWLGGFLGLLHCLVWCLWSGVSVSMLFYLVAFARVVGGVLVYLSFILGLGGVCFPFCRGEGLINWKDCLVACLRGLAFVRLSYARCVGLFVFDFVSG